MEMIDRYLSPPAQHIPLLYALRLHTQIPVLYNASANPRAPIPPPNPQRLFRIRMANSGWKRHQRTLLGQAMRTVKFRGAGSDVFDAIAIFLNERSARVYRRLP